VKRRYADVAIARIVYRSRRITVPQELGILVLGEEKTQVVWTMAGNSSRTAMLRRFDPLRDTANPWVRTVTQVWQVPLPAELMDRLGLAVEEWVYLQRGSDGRSLRVTPASAVDLMPSSATSAPAASR
jgi:hypothetical protein